jgi:AcrR family transcriptional regulator
MSMHDDRVADGVPEHVAAAIIGDRRGVPAALHGAPGMVRRKTPARPRTDGEITRNRILDSAEQLFAIDGYTGVSVRQITAAAEVDLALVNYHFGSKEKLFHEVLIRRVDRMSLQRMESLRAIEIRRNDERTVEALLDAFLDPIIGKTPEDVRGLRNYRLLVALVTNSKNWQDMVFKEHYDPVASRYIDALARVLPTVPRARICWAFSFFLGSVVNALAETGRVDRLSGGACRSSDLAEVKRELILYSVGAFLGLVPARRRERRKQRSA